MNITKDLNVVWNKTVEEDSRGREITVYSINQWHKENKTMRSIRLVEDPVSRIVTGGQARFSVEVLVSEHDFLNTAQTIALREAGIDPSEYSKINHIVK